MSSARRAAPGRSRSLAAHRAGLLTAVVLATPLAGCTARSAPAATTPGPATVITRTATAAASTVVPVSEAPIPPSGPLTETATDACPYISNDDARAAEGDRVGRVTLTSTQPPGCNFYFQYDTTRMIMKITVDTYPSQTGAYNAMVRTADASTEKDGVPGLVPGVDAVVYRTAFYPPDGTSDWACAFAKDAKVVTVYTQQDDVSFNAKNAATQIASRF